MNILALDTATEACSVALLRSDQSVFGEFELAPRQHNRLLPMMLDQVVSAAGLQRSEINYCAYTNGPGAFTGIRIGTAQAQGIGLALGIPLVPISTLAVIAQHCFDKSSARSVIATLDARMGEIYWARYCRGKTGLADLQGSEKLTSVSNPLPLGDIDTIVGSGVGVLALPEVPPGSLTSDPHCLPDARFMLGLAERSIELGRCFSASVAPINYLRNQVAEKSAAR